VMRENLWRHIYAILATRNRKRLRRLNWLKQWLLMMKT
jgi:hypothetical protein